MDVTRRQFLGCAAGAVTVALPLDLWRSVRAPRPTGPHLACAVLDLGEHCSIRESLSGYRSALARLDPDLVRAEVQSVSRCAVVIVPAAAEIQRSLARLILSCLHGGSTVILESGAAFGADGEACIHAQDHALRECLQLRVEAPTRLWPRPSTSRAVPYVDYSWPSAVKVRDFSRVVALEPQEGQIIARVDGFPVALRRRVASGTLVFLGSPLGPALWSGDAEASRWLTEVLRIARASRD